MTRTPERLDGISRQLGPLLSAQELRQDGDALRGGLADVEREALAERSLHDLDPIAALEPWRLRQLDQSIALVAADRRDDPVGDAFFNAALRRANNLKDAFLMARSLVLKRELREGFEPSHPQMAGGAKVEPLLVAHPLGGPRRG